MAKAQTKLLIVGIDGAGFDIITEMIEQGHLPHLAQILAEGAGGPLLSTNPPVTFPAWSSFLTGADPSEHGLTDFTIREEYKVRFIGASARRLPTLFNHFESQGFKTGAAWFPTTYPPEPLSGFMIAGWDSPVTDTGSARFVHPPSLHNHLQKKFDGGHLSFSSFDEFEDAPDWHSKAKASLVSHVERRAEIACWLLKNRTADVAAFYFGETDTAAHHFWAFHDENSPRRPKDAPQEHQAALREVYQAVDRAIGRLRKITNDCPILLLSDHGSGGLSNWGLCINRALEEAGLLKFNPQRLSAFSSTTLRNQLPRFVPPKLRPLLFRLGGSFAPSLVESRLRFGSIDFSRTVAFSEELSYAPSVWYNQLGREPKGILRAKDRHRAQMAVEKTAAGLKSPAGHSLVENIVARDELYKGPYIKQIPDLILQLAPIDGYRPTILSSQGKPGPAVSLLADSELLGRKGLSLPGCHTRYGFWATSTKALPILAKNPQLALEHVAALACELLNTSPADQFKRPGQDSIAKAPFDKDVAYDYNASEEELIAQRLKSLGYL